MNGILKISFTLFTIIILAANCQNNKSNDLSVNNDQESILSSITNDTLSVTEVSVNNEDSVGQYHLRIQFANGKNEWLNYSINEYIMEALGGTYEGNLNNGDEMVKFYQEQKSKEYQQFLNEYDVLLSSSMRYLYDAEIYKTADTDTYVTYQFNCETYMGGAHGSYIVMGQTFRKYDGRRISWSILTQPYDDSVQRLLRDGLKQYWQISNDEELRDHLLNEDNYYNLPLPQCPPLLDGRGITFVYQQYEIASYADGLPSFTIPYEKISPYLNITGQRLFCKLVE